MDHPLQGYAETGRAERHPPRPSGKDILGSSEI
jgi:hypothetical protein